MKHSPLRIVVGIALLLIALVAAWRASVDWRDQTRLVIEIAIAIVAGGIGTQLIFRTED